MLWDWHVGMEWWLIIGGILWSIFWATVFYLALLALSRLAPGLQERAAPLENAKGSTLAVKSAETSSNKSAAI